MTRFDILKGKVPALKKPGPDFLKPNLERSITIVIGDKNFQGYVTGISHVQLQRGDFQKRVTLTLLPNDQSFMEIRGQIQKEILFYAYDLKPPQKMFVEQYNVIYDLEVTRVELTGIIT